MASRSVNAGTARRASPEANGRRNSGAGVGGDGDAAAAERTDYDLLRVGRLEAAGDLALQQGPRIGDELQMIDARGRGRLTGQPISLRDRRRHRLDREGPRRTTPE